MITNDELQALREKNNIPNQNQTFGIGSRYRVRWHPDCDLWCVVDREFLAEFFDFKNGWLVNAGYKWSDPQDAIEYIKLIERAYKANRKSI